MDEFQPHLMAYSLDGARWSITVQATSEADARRRLSSAAMGSFDGIVMATIAAYPGVGLGLRFTCWLRNLVFGSHA